MRSNDFASMALGGRGGVMVDRVGVDDVIVVLGEVHTGLLQSSTSLPPATCGHLLSLARGEPVRQFERPIAHAVSPDLLTGVDCRLPTRSETKVRAVGTVAASAAITGGRVVQSSATVRVSRAATPRRQPWAHYLARPGQLEMIGTAELVDIVDGFISTKANMASLDLSVLSGHRLDAVQTAASLDRKPPFRAARTRLRWAATIGPEPGPRDAEFVVEYDQLRTVRLSCTVAEIPAVSEFCLDLALHDWLLTTLLHLMARSRIGAEPSARVVGRLRPAVDHLLHLWMPAARSADAVAGLWETVERRPGLSRQWGACVDRIRDQMALATIAVWSAGPPEARG
jgi:hypothetical protein